MSANVCREYNHTETHQRQNETRDAGGLQADLPRPRQADRTTGSLFESGDSEARRLRCPSIGRQGANLSSFVERIVRAHLEDYAEEIEEWRKL